TRAMSQQRPFDAELLHRPGLRPKRAQRPPPGLTTRASQVLRSFFPKHKVMAALGGGAVVAALVWTLTPFAGGHALADLLKEQGYWEIAAPADFYMPGTIHTIEVRSDGKIELHPTCTINADVLARMTIASRTVDRIWDQRLDKKFD